jgi:hypothetical protein
MSGKVRRWTPEEDAIIIGLKRQGKTPREIAEAMGPDYTPGSIKSRWQKRLRNPDGPLRDDPWTPEEDDYIQTERAKGNVYTKIARELRRPAGAVTARAKTIRERLRSRKERQSMRMEKKRARVAACFSAFAAFPGTA